VLAEATNRLVLADRLWSNQLLLRHKKNNLLLEDNQRMKPQVKPKISMLNRSMKKMS